MLSANTRLKHYFGYKGDLIGLSMKKLTFLLWVHSIRSKKACNVSAPFRINKYSSRVRFCMNHTDSLMYNTYTDEVHKKNGKWLNLFNNLEYDMSHARCSQSNMKNLERSGKKWQEACYVPR